MWARWLALDEFCPHTVHFLSFAVSARVLRDEGTEGKQSRGVS
jgi:hypothetical protein